MGESLHTQRVQLFRRVPGHSADSWVSLVDPVACEMATDDDADSGIFKDGSKSFFAGAQGLLCPFALGNIGEEPLNGRCAVPGDPHGFNLHVDGGAVHLEIQALRPMHGGFAGQDAAEVLCDVLMVVGMNEFEGGARKNIVRLRGAEKGHGHGVDVDGSSFTEYKDAGGGEFDQGSVTFLAFPQRLFCPLALGDVADEGGEHRLSADFRRSNGEFDGKLLPASMEGEEFKAAFYG